ncbi:hypothetical protein BC939DRAFT_498896 [Gamsiella multidivaricata]|uniref:uncharacterized protein n=1 Tax=Gamsiella multidivaricata TaxID=101098 RepID=UPI002220A028|nr:uncharacterized protein BC939DRAFT_498896 [Gamsiella multidivaricata]KAG0367454.1 DASH complex subunit ask1 [Gamsiella multidivaricata]KAI7831448.1 hypothetical protein BC939DRAFT_498896 [Gamsiella multidivaricata]
MSSSPQSTAEVLDEIERLEQSITRTLQEIDQSFSDCQIIVSSKILPQIDRYAESSREVWEHARRWLSFFEAASMPSIPTAGRRAQEVREARMRQQAAMDSSQEQANSTTPDYSVLSREGAHYDEGDDSTNRRRIDSINLSSPRFSPDFLNSPLGSIPSTPTPLPKDRSLLCQQVEANITPPAAIRWPDIQDQANEEAPLKTTNAQTTPDRPRYQFNTNDTDPGSTTPTITFKDRPISMPHTTQSDPVPPKSPAGTSHRPQQSPRPPRDNQSEGFVEFDIEEDYQDVITPPSTLHFSVPEAKLPTTPRSIVAKSLVDRIRMRDGLVIPQPIFISDDEEDEAIMRKYMGNTADESAIGGSKKRSRDGDMLDQENAVEGSSRGWASLSDHQRNKERLLKSPRKMVSVQDFFSTPFNVQGPDNSTRPQKGQGTEGEDSQSPSRQLISQIQSQTDPAQEEHEDPLLAALVTPPDIRKSMMEYKARESLKPQQPATTLTTGVTSKSLLSKVSAPFMSIPTSARSTTEVSSRVSVTSAASTTPLAASESHLTSTPIGTAGADSSTARNPRTDIDSIFMKSFNTGFASSSNRRQTMATPVDHSRNLFRSSILGSGQGQSGRKSIGAGFNQATTPTLFDSPRSAGSTNSGLGLSKHSILRRPMYPTSPSPASRAAASAIASAAATSSVNMSQATGHQGIANSNQTTNMGDFIFGAGRSRAGTHILSTPVVSTASMLTRMHDTPSTTATHPDSDFSSRGFLTPFANRNPPPAPKLGYHSDTIMTQSSLGLNHDGFGGFESEDQTRMTAASNGSSGISSMGLAGAVSQRKVVSTTESSEQIGSRLPAPVHRRIGEGGDFGDDESEDDDDEDITENIMRSPCPPGRTFYGSRTDLKVVAQATASARSNAGSSSGSSLFRRQ